jgi:hypothetical protein
MSRLFVPFLALALAAIVPALSPAQAAPRHDQVARATSTEPTARQHPRHHQSAHTTHHRQTHTAHHSTRTTNHHVAHNRTHHTSHGRTSHPTTPTSPT